MSAKKEMKKFIFNFEYPQILQGDMHLFLGLYTCFTPPKGGYSPSLR